MDMESTREKLRKLGDQPKSSTSAWSEFNKENRDIGEEKNVPNNNAGTFSWTKNKTKHEFLGLRPLSNEKKSIHNSENSDYME